MMKNTSSPNDSVFDFARWKRLLEEHYLLMVVVSIGCAAAAWLYAQTLPRIYSAQAVLQVESQERKVLNKIENVNQDKLDSEDYLKTVADLLSGNSLMLKVARENGLDKDLTVTSGANEATYSEPQLVKAMQRKFQVGLRRGTRLIDIVALDQNPVRACALANSLANAFLKQAYEQNASMAHTANQFLLEEAQRLKVKLEASEQKLQRYREEHQAVSLEDKQNITVEKLKELNSKVTGARSERMKLEADLDRIQRTGETDIDGLLRVGSIASAPQVAEVRTQLVRAQTDFAAVQQRYRKAHPKYAAALSQISDLSRSLSDAVRKVRASVVEQFHAAANTEEKLSAALKEQERNALALDKIAIPYKVLAREADSDRLLFENIVTRLKETGVTQGVQQVPYQIVETAMADPKPVAPQKMRLTLLGFLGGCLLAVGFILVGELFDGTFRSVEQAENALDLPALGAIPERRSEKDELMMEEPSSAQAEAFRSLRSSLATHQCKDGRLALAIASAVPLEGKSYVALNIAGAFARQEMKTLVIDADLRRPRLSKILLGPDRGLDGLTEYLRGLVTQASVVHRTEHANLFVLPAGEPVGNPSELLAQPRFGKLIAALRKEFDRIVIDTAPVLVVSDLPSIASQLDAICLITRAAKTPIKTVIAAKQQLIKTGGTLIGFVINRIPRIRHTESEYYSYSNFDGKARGVRSSPVPFDVEPERVQRKEGV